RWGSAPSSRSAYHRGPCRRGPQPGFPRSTRVRPDRGGCPLYPGAVVSTRPDRNDPVGTRCFPAASPATPLQPPITGIRSHETSIKGSQRSPVRSSSRPWLPHGTGALRFSPAPRPLPLPATHVGARTDPRTLIGDYPIVVIEPPKVHPLTTVRPRVALPPCGVPVGVSCFSPSSV